MIELEVWYGDHAERITSEDDVPVLVGRRSSAHVHLPNDYVSSEHAIIHRDGGQLFLTAVGTNPTYLDGQPAPEGEPVPLADGALIEIRSFKIRVISSKASSKPLREDVLQRCAEFENALFEATLSGIRFEHRTQLLPDKVTEEGLEVLNPSFDAAFAAREADLFAQEDVCEAMLARLFRRVFLRSLVAERDPELARNMTGVERLLPVGDFMKGAAASRVVAHLRSHLATKLSPETGVASVEALAEVALGAWEEDDALPRQIVSRLSDEDRHNCLREELRRRIVNLAFALGPLEDLLETPGITEILIIGPQRIFVEMAGRLHTTGDTFPSAETTRRILERAVSRGGRRIDMSQPLVDVQLEDGSRLNAVIHPLSRSGDVLTIRRFRAKPFSLDDLVANQTLSPALNRFLSAAVRIRKNIVVAGGTGSGKTTLLAALVAQIDHRERVVLIEDTAEIRLASDLHAVCLQSRPANIEGKGEVTIRQLVRNALRMRPDRLIVGECRGPEALDVLQAMNTGHPGSFTTVHANSCEEAISRLEIMVLQGVALPLHAIRWQVASSVDLIIQIGRAASGRRRILEVAAVAGFDERSGKVLVTPVFVLTERGDEARYHFTGAVPRFMADLERIGLYSLEECLDG